jgi:hypothetical protein
MYGYPGSIAIRYLLDEPKAPTHAPRTSTDRHATRWLVAVLVAPLVLAVVMAALLVSAAPSQAASAQASSVQSRYICHPTWRWSGCIPPQIKRHVVDGKRVLLYGGPYTLRTHVLAKRP